MSNFAETKAELRTYIVARTPLVIIDTAERERAERMLDEIAAELGIEIGFYTDARQVERLPRGQMLPGSGSRKTESVDADGDPNQYIAKLFRTGREKTFTVGDVKRISEDTMYSREIVNLLYLARDSRSTLILITPERVLQRIAQFGMIARLDPPQLDERIVQIAEFASKYRADRSFTIEWDEDDIQRAATLLRGFTEIQINNILSTVLCETGGLYRRDIFRLTAQKSKLYAAVSSVDEIEVSRDMQVSGLENLKEWLQAKKQVFFATDARLGQFGLEPPKGVLLTGVPGCGKSYSAKMIAKEWELPLFRFDIGSIYDKWMGESERKMQEALRFIDNVSPCIVWIDEIEKGLAVSDTGNDTGKRILGQFLFWLQESKSRTFLVATANDITQLPPELFRKGRFSEVFFIDLPSAAERRSALLHYNERCLGIRFTEAQTDELVQLSEGFSFAEIEYTIKELAEIMMLKGRESFSMELIRSAFRRVVKYETRNAEILDKIKAWGDRSAVPASKREEA